MIKSQTIKDLAHMLAIIATVVGGVWVMLGEINEVRTEIGETRNELHKENAKTRDELRKENAETRGELRKENAETRDELRKENAETRENVKIIETKIDEFKVSHEREHDIFYGQGDQGDQGSQADQ